MYTAHSLMQNTSACRLTKSSIKYLNLNIVSKILKKTLKCYHICNILQRCFCYVIGNVELYNHFTSLR